MFVFKGKSNNIYKKDLNYPDTASLKEKSKEEIENNRGFVLELIEAENIMRLELSKRLSMRNSFNPIFFGEIKEQSGKIKLSGYFGIRRYTSAIIILLYGFFAFFTLVDFFSTVFSRDPIETVLNISGKTQTFYAPWWSLSAFGIGILFVLIMFQTLCNHFQKNKRVEILSMLEKL